MNDGQRRSRGKAAAAAALLLLAGGLSGVLVDRLWLLPEAEAMPLTTQAMASRLNLNPSEETRIRALLDSMHAEVSAAAQHGPDSLRMAARSAHRRLEAALPPEARPEFRIWMQDQHRQMMGRMGGGRMHRP